MFFLHQLDYENYIISVITMLYIVYKVRVVRYRLIREEKHLLIKKLLKDLLEKKKLICKTSASVFYDRIGYTHNQATINITKSIEESHNYC